jgi:protoheme IX farnesyltransferase
VAFSSGIGYVLAERNELQWDLLFLFLMGGFGITVAANIFNQLLEKDSDLLMQRTMSRPLPANKISTQEGFTIAVIAFISGILLLHFFATPKALGLSIISLVLYAFVYTPLKTKTPLAVIVGAFPGAFPPMIGWLAVTNEFGWEPGALFGIQFFWQFPHFWAIAWVLHEDYKKASIKLLPTPEPGRKAAKIMVWYTLCLLPMGWVPYLLGMSDITSAFITFVCGLLFLFQTLYLWKVQTRKAALMLMFGSFLYLPIVQIALVLDRI